jgi:hypothetical protein
MQISDILAQTGGLELNARELGIPEKEVANGAAALLPAILGGFKRQAKSQPTFEGDSHVEWFAGNHQDYEADCLRSCRERSAACRRTRQWARTRASRIIARVGPGALLRSS